MRCLAEAIYFESRSEPEEGQAAVAQVVLNRVRSGIFPTNVCAVVYQDRNHPFACQFSFACEGKSLRIEEPGRLGDGDPHRPGGRQRRELQSEGRRGAQLSRQLRLSVLGAVAAPRRPHRRAYLLRHARRRELGAGRANGRGDLPPLGPQAQLAPGVETTALLPPASPAASAPRE